MSKNETRKRTKASNTQPNMDRARSVYPVESADLDRQQVRQQQAATAAKNALKTGAVKVEFPRPAPSAPPQTPAKEASAAPTAVSAPQATKTSQTAALPKIVNVSFVLKQPAARRVSLCGEFNRWSPDAGPMTRHEDGRWEAIVALAPGRYEYKFLVDGEWLPDPVVRETVPNGFGSLNSVIEVRD